MIGFIEVVLRGAILFGQALTIGGVVFVLLVLRPQGGECGEEDRIPVGASLALVAVGAAGFALAQAALLAIQLAALADGGAWPLRQALATPYFEVSGVRLLVGVAVVAWYAASRKRPTTRLSLAVPAGLALAAGVLSAFTSHAASRIEHRPLLLTLDAVHEIAASTWVGGLLHLLVAAWRASARRSAAVLLARFSSLALTAVVVLVVAGAGLTLHYVDGIHAFLGTAYGVMVLTKIVMLAGVLVLAALNFSTVRRLRARAGTVPPRMRAFVEVELGVAITVLFAAASLTSTPAAVDVVADRAALSEVATRFTPQWPRFTSPKLEDLPVTDRDAPRTDADRAWSEYNHHVSGLFVLAMGILTVVAAAGWARWTRHWPLVFLGLAAFMFVRNDPGAWPVGPEGFWASMRDPSVLQHRLFVLLVIAFGVFEWMVSTGRLGTRRARLLFPLMAAVGGGLLLTHSHASTSLKVEFLTEVTHIPLALTALVMGWMRWLELRLTPHEARLPSRIWPVALTLVGVLLLLYRES